LFCNLCNITLACLSNKRDVEVWLTLQLHLALKASITLNGVCGEQATGSICNCQRMPSSEMLRSVARVRTDVSEQISPSTIRVTRIGVVGSTF
jgi:hypothetical protein